MAMPADFRTDRRTCPCGCEMFWHKSAFMWLCTHCDLDETEADDDD